MTGLEGSGGSAATDRIFSRPGSRTSTCAENKALFTAEPSLAGDVASALPRAGPRLRWPALEREQPHEAVGAADGEEREEACGPGGGEGRGGGRHGEAPRAALVEEALRGGPGAGSGFGGGGERRL